MKKILTAATACAVLTMGSLYAANNNHTLKLTVQNNTKHDYKVELGDGVNGKVNIPTSIPANSSRTIEFVNKTNSPAFGDVNLGLRDPRNPNDTMQQNTIYLSLPKNAGSVLQFEPCTYNIFNLSCPKGTFNDNSPWTGEKDETRTLTVTE